MVSNVIDTLRNINEGHINPKDISSADRRTCVAYLRLEGYSQQEIAEIFNVHRLTIIRDEKINRNKAAKLVDEIDIKAEAGNLIVYAKHLTAKAIREKDYNLAWKIQRELVSDLQSLGYLPKAPEQHQVQIGTFVDLVQLAAKQVDATLVENKVDKSGFLPDETKSVN